MPRAKKQEITAAVFPGMTIDVTKETQVAILPLSIDYSNEGLNNIARKINEIIDRING